MSEVIALHQLAEECLLDATIEAKLTVTDRAERALITQAIDLSAVAHQVWPAEAVRFPERPSPVAARALPKRGLNSPEGLAAFLHAIAHIEFTAIHLAWDLAYRFPGLPERFYRDWLQVAIEEARHFRLLSGRLAELGFEYGDFPAHRGLWSLAERTQADLLHRLAVIPRFMEARGLDVTPGMIERLVSLGDSSTVAILEVIIDEEVGHVALGTRWLAYVCHQRGVDAEESYFAAIRHYLGDGVRGPFNKPARRAAGFSEVELERLERMSATPGSV